MVAEPSGIMNGLFAGVRGQLVWEGACGGACHIMDAVTHCGASGTKISGPSSHFLSENQGGGRRIRVVIKALLLLGVFKNV